jgi:magnesium transporter
MRRLEELTAKLFMEPIPGRGLTSNSEELAAVLRGIGDLGVEVSIIRESIASLQRVLNFARAHLPDDRKGGMAGVMDSLKNDLTALSDEAAFFMSKLSFNLDATLGLINIDETRVIRLLSIVTLVLSPPLLIAGIYGMNFQNMPELAWDWGDFAALALMALASIAGVWYLRRRTWL